MSRTPSPLLLAATLLLGVVVGMTLDRGVRPLSAQATGAARADSTPTPTSPPVAQWPQAKGGGEEEVYRDLARQYELFLPVNRTFELVSKAVSPAVVHIVARKAGHARNEGGGPTFYEETGSGVIIRPERGRDNLYILTNNHVIDGANSAEVNIVLHDGRVLHPQRTWSDLMADVAVLKLGHVTPAPPAARLGDSDEAAVGSWVLALGSPFGLTHSVSQGIISARGRHEDELREDGVENQDFLQTDAAINPGNSGGPLVNLKGEVIGINTAIASNGGGNEGVGFSIPINLAKWIMGQLVATGKVSRGAMGITLDDLKPEGALKLGLDRPRGARVSTVSQPSPAAEAGLSDGDVIIRFDGKPVVDLNHLINMVTMTPIGTLAEVVVWRDRKELVKRVRIADKDTLLAQAPPVPPSRPAQGELLRRPARPPAPGVDSSASTSKALGLELITLDRQAARGLGLSEALQGAAVVRVDPNSPLAAACRPRDVITQVDGQPIRSAEEVIRALARRVPKELTIQRPVNGLMQRHAIPVPR